MAKPWFSAALVLVVCTNIFILASFVTRLYWTSFSRAKEPWVQTRCDVLDSNSVNCQSNFDISVTVRADYELNGQPAGSPSDNVTAFRVDAFPRSRPEECKFNTEAAAEEAAAEFEPGMQIDCFASEFFERVTLEDSGTSPEYVRSVKTRAILFVVAAIVAGICVLFALYNLVAVLRHSRRRRNPWHSDRPLHMPHDAFPHNMRAERSRVSYAYRRPLSGHDARMFVAALERDMHAAAADDLDKGGTCAICLEEFEATVGRARVKLPCGHLYHSDCAMQWFRKGSSFCPYCHYDVLSDVREMRVRRAAERLAGEDVRVSELPTGAAQVALPAPARLAVPDDVASLHSDRNG